MAPTVRRAGLAPASAWRDVCGFPRSSTQHAGDKPRPHRPRQQGGGGAPSEGRGRRRGRSSCQGEHLRLTYRFLKEATATLRRESEAEAPISISGTLQLPPPMRRPFPGGGLLRRFALPLKCPSPARALRGTARDSAHARRDFTGPARNPSGAPFVSPESEAYLGLCVPPAREEGDGRVGEDDATHILRIATTPFPSEDSHRTSDLVQK